LGGLGGPRLPAAAWFCMKIDVAIIVQSPEKQRLMSCSHSHFILVGWLESTASFLEILELTTCFTFFAPSIIAKVSATRFWSLVALQPLVAAT
jgi:hypothetical protein